MPVEQAGVLSASHTAPAGADAVPAPLRVCVAGAGAISPFHLAGWQAQGGVELTALCDSDSARCAARAQAFGITRTYQDFAAMLDAERPHAVDIVTPVGTHAPLARLAAARGVHVMCQKPLTPTVAEAAALIADIGERVRFMVHENYRFRPHYQAVGALLREGRIGAVRHARMSVRCSGMAPAGPGLPALLARQPYLAEFPRLLVFEVLIHHLDVLRWLLGPLQVVSARLDRVSPLVRGEDVALVTLAGAGGMTVLLDGHLSARGAPALPVDRLELLGEDGTLLFDGDELALSGSDAPPRRFDLAANYQACFSRAIADFVHGLRTGTAFQTDRLDNLETLRLMESCYRAAGVPVD